MKADLDCVATKLLNVANRLDAVAIDIDTRGALDGSDDIFICYRSKHRTR